MHRPKTDPETEVSTHSRPKAAGIPKSSINSNSMVSTHSRPKAAGPVAWVKVVLTSVSTHSRLKAAGLACKPIATEELPFQHTAA